MSYRHSSYRKVRRALAKLQEPYRAYEGQRILTKEDARRLTWAELARVESREWGGRRWAPDYYRKCACGWFTMDYRRERHDCPGGVRTPEPCPYCWLSHGCDLEAMHPGHHVCGPDGYDFEDGFQPGPCSVRPRYHRQVFHARTGEKEVRP